MSTPVITRPKVKALSVAEIQSNGRPDSGFSGRVVQPIASAAMPMGMLTPNSQGHGPTARIPEAMVGPSAREAETTMALRPMPRPRLRWG